MDKSWICFSCEKGFYLKGKGVNAYCTRCKSNCEECTNEYFCKKCKDNYSYDSDNNRCVSCEETLVGCKQCRNVNTCQYCFNGFTLDSSTKKCLKNSGKELYMEYSEYIPRF
mgnify:FL=1